MQDWHRALLALRMKAARGESMTPAEQAQMQELEARDGSTGAGVTVRDSWGNRMPNAERAAGQSALGAGSVAPPAGGGSEGPFRFVDIGGGILRVPNPEWGRQNGFAWDDVNQRWRPRSSEDDIRDQLAQMEMDKRRFDMDRARRDYERERQWAEQDRTRKMAEEDFKRQQEGWAYQELQRRTAEASQPMTPQPSQDSMMDYRKRELADENERFAKQQAARQEAYRKSIGFNPGTQPAKNAYMPVIPPSAAQPVEPQSEGTPYGQQDASAPASAFGFKPAPGGNLTIGRVEWWHNPATRQETQAAVGSVAPPGWVKGRLGDAPAPQESPTAPPKYPVGPDGGRWFGTGLRAKDDPSNPRSPQFQKPILIAPGRPRFPMVY